MVKPLKKIILQNQENTRSQEEDDRITLVNLNREDKDEPEQPEQVTDEEVNDKKTGPESVNFKNAKKKEVIFPVFNRNETLPKSLKESMTAGAQTIFRESYNSIIQNSNNVDEAISFAWLEVKKKYKKVKSKWVRKVKKK